MNTQEGLLQKSPPQNQEAEMAVIGAIIIDRTALDTAAEKLSPEMFYTPANSRIYSTVIDLYREGKSVDSISLSDRLRSLGQLDSIGGASYLTDCMDFVSTTAHIESWIGVIRDKYTLRRLISTAGEIIQKCHEEQEDVENLLDSAESQVFEIAEKRLTESYRQINPLLIDVVQRIESVSTDKHYVSGISSGFYDLDELTSGFQNSDMIVLAARPSIGKTAFALRIAEHIAVENKMPVAFFSLEMSSHQLVQRMLVSRAKLDSNAVRKGILSEKAWRQLKDAANVLTNAPIYVNDTPSLGALQLRAISRRLKSSHGIQMIFIDYLQLMQGPGRRYESRQQEISDISRALKSLARELQIPVMVLSQLNREVESRPNKRPQLSDLRESGAIEQDADVVMLLMREEAYDPLAKPGIGEVMVAKQRNGPTGDIEVTFIGPSTRFEPKSTRSEPRDGEDNVNL